MRSHLFSLVLHMVGSIVATICGLGIFSGLVGTFAGSGPDAFANAQAGIVLIGFRLMSPDAILVGALIGATIWAFRTSKKLKNTAS